MHQSYNAPCSRHPRRGMQNQFDLIHFTSLFCLIAMGWAAALFL